MPWIHPARVICRDNGWYVVDAHVSSEDTRTVYGPMLSVELAAAVADEADDLLIHRLRVIGRALIDVNRWPGVEV